MRSIHCLDSNWSLYQNTSTYRTVFASSLICNYGWIDFGIEIRICQSSCLYINWFGRNPNLRSWRGSFLYLPAHIWILTRIPYSSIYYWEIVEKSKPISLKKLILASSAGLVSIYAIGLPYLYFIVNIYMGKEMPISSVIWSACIIFLPGDIIKILIASFLSLKIVKALSNYSV